MEPSQTFQALRTLHSQFASFKSASIQDKARYQERLDLARERNRRLEAQVLELGREVRLLKQLEETTQRDELDAIKSIEAEFEAFRSIKDAEEAEERLRDEEEQVKLMDYVKRLELEIGQLELHGTDDEVSNPRKHESNDHTRSGAVSRVSANEGDGHLGLIWPDSAVSSRSPTPAEQTTPDHRLPHPDSPDLSPSVTAPLVLNPAWEVLTHPISPGRPSSLPPSSPPAEYEILYDSSASDTDSQPDYSPSVEVDPLPQYKNAVALTDHFSVEEDELSFIKGDRITGIFSQESELWWGTAEDGSEGFFPAIFVTLEE